MREFLEIDENERYHELLAGELAPKASPSGEHGDAQAGVIGALRSSFHRKSGGGHPGGWWIVSEVEVLLANATLVRPDVVGWRRETCPERPQGTPIEMRPDWVCEIVSTSRPSADTVGKVRLYHAAGIPHYWIIDPRAATLHVLRWHEPGYVMVQSFERGELAHAEPFESLALDVGTFFGDDPRDE